MMHPEDEANTDAPLVPDVRPTNRPETTTIQGPRPGTEQDLEPVRRELEAIRGRLEAIETRLVRGGDRR